MPGNVDESVLERVAIGNAGEVVSGGGLRDELLSIAGERGSGGVLGEGSGGF